MQETAEPFDAAAAKQDIIDRTNALRRENGVSVLCVNGGLMQAAQVRADEMAAHTVYSHTRPNGGKFNTVTDCPYMAENIHRIADWDNVQPNTCRTGRGGLERFDNPQQEHGQPKAI